MPNGARTWDNILKQRVKTSMHVPADHSPHDVPTVPGVGLSEPVQCSQAYVTRHVTGVIQSV